MESLLSQETQDQVNIYFVLPKDTTETTCSEKLASSYQACLDVGFPSRWIKEADVLKMQPVKQDVFICDPFKGPAFEYLSSGNFKCVVLGPPCLLACLSRSEPVPELPYPLYTAAMRGMVVTSTGFEKPEKNRLQRLVRQMSGVYSSDFHEGVTHLVAGIVASPKYQVAVTRDAPVMRAAWVDRVWEASRQQTVAATDPQFADLTCPPFEGLHICVSQISRRDKEAIKRLIENNGGHYMTQLECEKTSVLVSPSVEGEKVTFARRWKIPCVMPEWLYDSVERGSCLAMEEYETSDKAKRASTPTKNHTAYGELADLTMSTIVGANESRLNPVDETTMNETASFAVPAPAPSAAQEELSELDRVDLQQVAKAGEFLDGCKIHCMGFDARRDDKLRRLLNTSGAMRFSQLLPSVTHVVLAGGGAVPEAAVAAQWRPHLVTLRWVLDSWRAGRPLPEADFLPPGVEPPEPPAAGQRTELELPGEETVMPGAEATTAGEDTLLEATQTLFGGLQFCLSRELDAESRQEVLFILEEHGGRQVESADEARFTVVPLVHPGSKGGTDDRLVTTAYLQHCVEADKLLEPEYYHRPISTTRDDILTGCVLGISSYSGRERQYLALLGESMGAEFQEVFARRDNPAKHARASTHLVCQSAEGHKYAAARKWGLPAVSREWLRACVAAGRRLPTDEFTVEGSGESTVGSVASNAVSAAPSHTATPAAPAAAAAAGAAAAAAGAAAGLPGYMQPPVELTPVRPPRLPPADSVARAAAVTGGADMATPLTPYGALVSGANPSSSTRKAWKRYVDAMDETPESKRRRVSTPMSQLVVQFFKSNFSQKDSQNDHNSSVENSPVVNSKAVNAALQSEAAGAGSPVPPARSSARLPARSAARTTPARSPPADLGGSPCLGQASVREQPAPAAAAAATLPLQASPPAGDVTADVTERTAEASDVSRQLAELNRLVSRRSGGGGGSGGERRIPSLDEPPPAAHPESESAPHGTELNTQGTAVTWDDPRERQARNNLMSEEVGHQNTENVSPNMPAAAAASSKPAAPPVLVFSGMEPAERTRYAALAERLGGTVLDSATLELSATHLVTTRPNRSEKHLAAVASGRWLLQPAYLAACERAGHFLQEDAFEWGDPECLRAAGLSKDSTEYKLSSAAYRWRRKIKDEGIPGAFHSMVAVLLTAKERSRAFERLVTAGGGRAASLEELRREPTAVTHVFIEPARADKRQLTPELWRELARRRLPCLQPVYLNECLTAATAPRTDDWLVEEYRRLLAET